MASGYRGGKYYSHLPSTPSTPSKPVGGGSSYSPSSASVPASSSGSTSTTISSSYNPATRTTTTLPSSGSAFTGTQAEAQAAFARTAASTPSTPTYDVATKTYTSSTGQKQSMASAPSGASIINTQSLASSPSYSGSYNISNPTYINPFTGQAGTSTTSVAVKPTGTYDINTGTFTSPTGQKQSMAYAPTGSTVISSQAPMSTYSAYDPTKNLMTGQQLNFLERMNIGIEKTTQQSYGRDYLGRISQAPKLAMYAAGAGIYTLGSSIINAPTTIKNTAKLFYDTEYRSAVGTQMGTEIKRNPFAAVVNVGTQLAGGYALGKGVSYAAGKAAPYVGTQTKSSIGIVLDTKVKEIPSIYEGSRTYEAGSFAQITTQTTNFLDRLMGKTGKTKTELVPMYSYTKTTPTISTGLVPEGIGFVETKFGNVKVNVPGELAPKLRTQPLLAETVYMIEYGKRQGIATASGLAFEGKGATQVSGRASILSGRDLLSKPLSSQAVKAGITTASAREYGIPTAKSFNELISNIDLGSPKVSRMDIYFRDFTKSIGKTKPISEIYQLSKSVSVGELYGTSGKFLAGQTSRTLAKTFIEPSKFRISTDIQPFTLQEGKGGLVTTGARPTVGFSVPVAQALAKQVITPELPKVSTAIPKISATSIAPLGLTASLNNVISRNIKSSGITSTLPSYRSSVYEDITYTSKRMSLPQMQLPRTIIGGGLISSYTTPLISTEKVTPSYRSNVNKQISNLIRSTNLNRLSTKVSTPQIIKTSSPQITRLKTPTITRLTSITKITSTTKTIQRLQVPSVPKLTTPVTTIPIPIIPILPLPSLTSGFNDEAFARFVKPKKITRYTPSYTALVFNIRGKKPKGTETGLRIRPIPKGFSFSTLMR